MSATGDCWDHAVAESFFATIKGEMIDQESFETRAEATAAIADYIDGFYNVQRLHSSIGFSPIEFELRLSLIPANILNIREAKAVWTADTSRVKSYVDGSRWPLVLHRPPFDQADPRAISEWAEDLRELYERHPNESCCFITVLEGLGRVSATRRQQIAELRAKHFMVLSRVLACEAYVVPTSITQAALTAIRWFVPEAWPTKVFTDVKSAEEWATRCLDKTARSPADDR